MKNQFFRNAFEDALMQTMALGSYPLYVLVLLSFAVLQQYESAMFLLAGLVILYLLAVPLRLAFFRERPEAEHYHNVIEKINASSFPSLHAARSVFLWLFFVSFVFPKNMFMVILLSIVAVAVIWGRVYFKKHYMDDVIAGALLSVALFWMLTTLY